MLKNSLHTKWVVRFFVLIYLLLMTGTGNAFFWCKDAESHPHLESTPGGKCWMPCPSEPEEHQGFKHTPNAKVVFSSAKGDCIDLPAISSAITSSNQNRAKNKVSITVINTPDSPDIQAERFSVENLSGPAPAHQLPLRQSLTALRTIVLLH